MANPPKSAAIRMREYRSRQKALKAAARQHSDLISENMHNASCGSLSQRDTVLGNDYNLEPMRIVPIDVYKQDSSPLNDNSNCLGDLREEANDDLAKNAVKKTGETCKERNTPISAANRMRAYRARLKSLKSASTQHSVINGRTGVANCESLLHPDTVDENINNSLRTIVPEDVHHVDPSPFYASSNCLTAINEQAQYNQEMNAEAKSGQRRRKQNATKISAQCSPKNSDRHTILSKKRKGSKKAKNSPKSGTVRMREYRARLKALKAASSQRNDSMNENVSVANCGSLPQPNTVDENIHNPLRTSVPLHQADSSPLCADSISFDNVNEQTQEKNAVKNPISSHEKQTAEKSLAQRSPNNRSQQTVFSKEREDSKSRNPPKSTAVRVREYRARQRALKAASSQHNDSIDENMSVANCESLSQPNTVEKSIHNPLRTSVPLHQADSSPLCADSISFDNSDEQTQEKNAVKKPISSREKQTVEKNLAQCSPNNRSRQTVLSKEREDSKSRNPPKSTAVRVREYRARQKALKAATSQHNNSIDENMSVANSESLPSTVEENIQPISFNNLNEQTQGYQENDTVKEPGPTYIKQTAEKALAQCAPNNTSQQNVLSEEDSEKSRNPALKTATSGHCNFIPDNVYAVKWSSLLNNPGSLRIIVPLEMNQPDSSPLQANSNRLSDAHGRVQDDKEINAVKKRAQACAIRDVPKSAAIRMREFRARRALKVASKNKMSTKKKRGCGWTEEVMAQALTAIKNGMPLIRASNVFNIPRRTLRNHVATGKSSKKLGCTSVLTPEQETELCRRIVRLADAGMPLTSHLLRRSVVTFCSELQAPHRFKKDLAGRKWLYLFLKRHPEISERVTETANLAKAANLNRQVIYDYFDRLKKLLLDYELMDKPERIFNIGEKVCDITLPHQHQVFAKEKSENATIVGCGNANGNSIPPMILLKRERFKPECVNNLPIGTAVEITEKSRMTADIFSKWVHHFSKFKPPGKVLLTFDGTKSHLDVNICKAAEEQDILLLCLPGNCTLELQPMDKTVFKSFESYWEEETMKYWVRNPESAVFRFGEIFFNVWVKSMTPEKIIAGFEETGIFPFDFTLIPEVVFAPSSSNGNPI